jgi:hypothetical protein
MSIRGNSMDQSNAQHLPSALEVLTPSSFTTSSAAATTGTTEEASSSFQVLPGGAADAGDDDTEIESGQLFGPTAAATASALLSPQHAATGASFSGFKSPGKGRTSRGGSGDVDVSGAQVAGLWVAGGSQVTRLSLQWAKDSISETNESTVMDQEVREWEAFLGGPFGHACAL